MAVGALGIFRVLSDSPSLFLTRPAVRPSCQLYQRSGIKPTSRAVLTPHLVAGFGSSGRVSGQTDLSPTPTAANKEPGAACGWRERSEGLRVFRSWMYSWMQFMFL